MSSSEFLVKVFYGDEVLVEYILPQGSTIVLDVAACAREMGVPSRFVTFATTAGVELERTAVNDSSSSSPTVEYNTPAAWCNLMQTGLVIGKLVVYLAGEGHDDPHSWFDDSSRDKEEETRARKKMKSYEVAGITFEDPAMQERYNFLTNQRYPPEP